MHIQDKRSEHLGWIEVELRTAHPDLPGLALSGQAHYGPADRLAFIEIYCVDHDRIRRRQIRADSANLLRRLGYTVEIEPGRDVYDMVPTRPLSAHDAIRMLQCLHEAYRRAR